MSNKYYAVRIGRRPGIYQTWDEARPEVIGYPDATFKSFTTLAEAQAFVGLTPTASPTKETSAADLSNTADTAETTVSAYVDGSFDKVTQRYSFGAVLIHQGQVIKKMTRVGANPKYQSSRQIAGEVFGALHAVQWATQNNFKKIILHYDYLGIEKWALGEWRTNKPVSIDYAASFQKLATQIEVEFVKVKAHSGVKYNEMVDQMAKDALRNTPIEKD